MNTITPNIVIPNPRIRLAVRTTIDTIGGLTAIAGAVDLASENMDITAWTIPIMAGYAAARSVFGFLVDNTNTPKRAVG